MGFLGSMKARLGLRQSAPAQPTTRDLEAWLRQRETKSGVAVNEQTALQVSAVLACVRVIAEGVAMLPVKIKRKRPDGRGSDAAARHPAHLLLSDTPNDWMTAPEVIEFLVAHAVLTGNGYALVARGVDGQPVGLYPVPANAVQVSQDKNWKVTYRIIWPNGRLDDVPAENMLHLRGPSWDGLVGMNVVTLAREAMGLSIAAEQSQAALFSNGGLPSGILTAEGDMRAEKAKELQKHWKEQYSGDNRGKIAMLWGGMKFQQISASSVDAQTLETRRMQVEEICRVFRVFAQMIGVNATTTYASAESFFMAHAKHTLGPWIRRLEATCDRTLLTAAERAQGYYTNISDQALLRADMKSRYAAYQSGINTGWLTRNEARAWEDLSPIDGLDEPLQPLNMSKAGDDPLADDPVEDPKEPDNEA